MTTKQIAAAVGVTRAAANRQAARFARMVSTPRGPVWIWPDTAPDGRPWSPEVWRELVPIGGPRQVGAFIALTGGMTTKQIATAVGVSRAAACCQALRFGVYQAVYAGKPTYVWPPTSPDGRPWTPEVWRELVPIGKPSCNVKISKPKRGTLERLAAGDALDGYCDRREGVWRYRWDRGSRRGPVHATVVALEAEGLVSVKRYAGVLACSVSLTEAGRVAAAVAPE